ncbi:MAG: tripartite tricarboxylate transporter substrate binding protein [Haliea sp.]|nr:MAG: tripartite tricarboxylate transporter substrate binding protein [Haliea sp.]
MFNRRQLIASTSLLLAAPFIRAQGTAAAFPAKPVTMVVPFAAGQSGDILARLIGEALTRQWGQPLVIDNKGGAGGTLGSIAVARANADGYTLLLGSSGPTAIAPSLYKKVGYDPNKDFTPIVNVAGVPQVLLVPGGSPYRTVQELVAAAKAQPGKLSYGSGGKGSTAHLTMELFKSMAGVEMEHVPYKGAGPAYPDLLAGRLDAMFDTTPAALPFIKAGQIRALGVSTAKRTPSLPDVPTLDQAGVKGFELVAWWGVVAPAGLNPAVQQRLNQEFRKVLALDEVRRKLEDMGMVVLAGSSDEFRQFIRNEHQKFAEVIRANNIVVE